VIKILEVCPISATSLAFSASNLVLMGVDVGKKEKAARRG
jgi:hypothetical protein